METQIFHHGKNIIINLHPKKKSSKRNQNPTRYYNSIIITNQVSTQAKLLSFQNAHIKTRPIN
jgi:hypothetical protein